MAKATQMNKGTKNTKATTNSKSVKENKTMANPKATATTTLTLTGSVETLIQVSIFLKENGIQCDVVEPCKVIEEAPATKTETKKTSTKAKDTKDQAEKVVKFDREKYLSVAEKLGVKYTDRKGKTKVYSFARETVYKAMDVKLTKKNIEKFTEEINEIAEKKAPYFLKNQKVEIEDEAE